MSDYKVLDERDNDRVYFDIELDDLGLDPYEFRIYARMIRRSSGGVNDAFESVGKMAEGCKMSPRKVHEVLRALEAHKLIRVIEQKMGRPTVYGICPKSKWATSAQRATSAPHADPPLHSVQTPSAPRADEVEDFKKTLKRELQHPEKLSSEAKADMQMRQGKKPDFEINRVRAKQHEEYLPSWTKYSDSQLEEIWAESDPDKWRGTVRDGKRRSWNFKDLLTGDLSRPKPDVLADVVRELRAKGLYKGHYKGHYA
jgi:hypothetical protein